MGCGVCRRRHFLGTVIGWAAAQTSRYITVSAPPAIHVTKSGSNSNTGCTWDDAKLTIQEGLNTASTEGISEVWVKAGTYEERITLKPSVGLYGGSSGRRPLYDGGGIWCDSSMPVIRNNVIRQNGGRNGGGLFLPNLASDRVHLTASSTWCIDRGWAAYAAGSTDIFGDPRIVNGVVDIGADEYP